MHVMYDKENSQYQRISPWAHIADQLRDEARELAEEDNQLGLLFRETQWDAYEAWTTWDEAIGKQSRTLL